MVPPGTDPEVSLSTVSDNTDPAPREAIDELEAFRFEADEADSDETDLETGCLSCS